MNEKSSLIQREVPYCRLRIACSLTLSSLDPFEIEKLDRATKKRCVYLLKLRDSNSNGISKELYKHNQKLWNSKKSSGSEQQQLQQSTAQCVCAQKHRVTFCLQVLAFSLSTKDTIFITSFPPLHLRFSLLFRPPFSLHTSWKERRE